MYRYQEVQGLPVIGITDGKEIGTLAGLVVDPDRKRVRWLSLNSGGRYEERHWIAVDDVQYLDKHAVKVTGQSTVRAPNEAMQAEEFLHAGGRIVGRPAVTEGGRDLGQVNDYEFETGTWDLTKLIVPRENDATGDAQIIDVHRVISVEQSRIIISESASR